MECFVTHVTKHSMTRHHPDKSSGYTHKLTASTYNHIPHKQSTNAHRRNRTW